MKRRFAFAGAVTAGLVMLSGGVAWAGVGANIQTTDSTPGGRAVFVPDGDKVVVCDQQADGYPVVAYLRRHDGPLWSTTRVGGVTNCAQRVVDIPEGEKLTLTVCLVINGKDSFCRTANVVA
ncbi:MULTISPECIES: hypothetical protein [unclassified Streptomyces]|uniref:hypothetical protein n=1 Tax=unclassified Streptomyces TaxID=2593676 RepID=UPI00380EA269